MGMMTYLGFWRLASLFLAQLLELWNLWFGMKNGTYTTHPWSIHLHLVMEWLILCLWEWLDKIQIDNAWLVRMMKSWLDMSSTYLFVESINTMIIMTLIMVMIWLINSNELTLLIDGTTLSYVRMIMVASQGIILRALQSRYVYILQLPNEVRMMSSKLYLWYWLWL